MKKRNTMRKLLRYLKKYWLLLICRCCLPR